MTAARSARPPLVRLRGFHVGAACGQSWLADNHARNASASPTINSSRSALVLTVAAVLAATVAIPAAPAAAGGTGWWAMSGYLVSNSAFNPNETTVTVPTVPNLKLKHTGTPARTGQRAPVVADGLVYTPDDRGVTATDEVTGAQKWRFELDPATFVMPTELVHTAGQVVLAANVILHSPGVVASQVFVLDAPTGTMVRDFDDEGVATQIFVDRGVVMVSGESRWAADTRAYRLADGQLLWQHDKYMQQPVSANGRVVLSGTGTAAKPLASTIVDIATGSIINTTGTATTGRSRRTRRGPSSTSGGGTACRSSTRRPAP
ncbi:outer membrane protein assembly factor BamB family protein [Micromonospora sp. LH3U1]|uniref:outer membrane protein assembly factor BamB family protein n=1 Tax=Micromonospora sp. LH3U1 TaxID=3018339 RepID=UPI00234BAFD4|nr:PQQ-binding-like beta-propeller repeat protein [Micromonospora sp. LH3U1]WCN83668.1 hypothetical protein PCA76_11730 [Micromonospora sp. LH3U1]